MIEILGAALGASITVTAMGMGAFGNRSREARDAVIRLTSAVETVATRLENLHVDIKADRREMLVRLSEIEQRLSKLEGSQMYGRRCTDT